MILWSLCGRPMSAKGANFFRGQISPDFRPLGGGFYPSRSVVENKCLIGHPRHPFRDKNSSIPRCRIGEAKTPTKLPFYFGGRFSWLSAARRKGNRQTVHNEKTAEARSTSSHMGEPFMNRGFRHFYFQSLKISSNAISRAAFMLLFRMANISASRVDFFFFFLSLSFFYWLILS